MDNITAKLDLSPLTVFFFLQKPKKSPKKSTKKLRVQPLIFIISSFFSFLLTIAIFFLFLFLTCDFWAHWRQKTCLLFLVFFSVKQLHFSFGMFSKIQQDILFAFMVAYTLIFVDLLTYLN